MMSVTCPKCRTIIETADTAFTLQQKLTAEREAREKAEAGLKATIYVRDTLYAEGTQLRDDIRRLVLRAESAEQRIREAMEQEPVAYTHKGIGFISVEYARDYQVDVSEMTKLYAAPIPPADVAELERKLHQSDLDFDALEKQNSELTSKLSEFQLSEFHPDWSMLQASQESLREHMQMIKDLERKLSEQQAIEKQFVDLLANVEEIEIDGISHFALPIETVDAVMDRYEEGYECADPLQSLLEEARKQAVPEELKEVLVAVFREIKFKKDYNDGNAPDHAHSTPGVWDDDNGDLSGTECAWCNLWNTAKQMLSAAPQPDDAAIRAKGN